MSEPFVAEIRLFPWNWAPQGWALCNGAQLAIAQNAALYALLGIRYGGNGTTTFNLPDMRGRTPVNYGMNTAQSVTYAWNTTPTLGAETVALTTAHLPAHTHAAYCTTALASLNPPSSSAVYGAVSATPGVNAPLYSSSTATLTALAPNTLATSGGSAAHSNMQPYLVLNFCIATTGLFPPRN
jgi:microcystin-dependent protein